MKIIKLMLLICMITLLISCNKEKDPIIYKVENASLVRDDSFKFKRLQKVYVGAEPFIVDDVFKNVYGDTVYQLRLQNCPVNNCIIEFSQDEISLEPN